MRPKKTEREDVLTDMRTSSREKECKKTEYSQREHHG